MHLYFRISYFFWGILSVWVKIINFIFLSIRHISKSIIIQVDFNRLFFWYFVKMIIKFFNNSTFSWNFPQRLNSIDIWKMLLFLQNIVLCSLSMTDGFFLNMAVQGDDINFADLFIKAAFVFKIVSYYWTILTEVFLNGSECLSFPRLIRLLFNAVRVIQLQSIEHLL